MEPEKCRSCGALIFWARNPKTGAFNPVDATPREDGNLILTLRPASGTLEFRFATKVDAATLAKHNRRYVSHFATCPNARQHRTRSAS